MKFPKSLSQPIKIATRMPGILSSPKDIEEIDRHNNSEFFRALTEQLSKIDELRIFLGLKEKSGDPTVDFVMLTLWLARMFVPGFRIKDVTLELGRGRKKEWDVTKYCQLLGDYELLQQEKAMSDSAACLALTKSPRFKHRWSEYSSSTLKNKLIEARKEDKNTFNKLRNLLMKSGNLSQKRLSEFLIEHYSITKDHK
jgi:hypothetical protein